MACFWSFIMAFTIVRDHFPHSGILILTDFRSWSHSTCS
jgi:hypothetical protein